MEKNTFYLIFFILLIICTTVLADIKYFSLTGKEITKEEYERICNEQQNEVDPISEKRRLTKKIPNPNIQNKVDIYAKKPTAKSATPENECKGIPSFDKYGSYVAYPYSCDPNGEKTLNSCFGICEMSKEEKFNDLIAHVVHFSNERENALKKLQKEYNECLGGCRKRIGTDI